jgi:cytochrome bd-type quinol oxidase subunit 2
MNLRRGLSIGGRLVVGLLLVAAMVYATRYFKWRSPGHAWLSPFCLPLLVILASLPALLIRSFCRPTVLETLVIISILFVLECLMLPAVVPHEGRHRPQAVSTSPVKLGR